MNKTKALIITISLAGAVALSAACITAAKAAENSVDISEKLHWHSDSDPDNLCHGYFIQPILDKKGEPILPPEHSQTIINADSGTFSQKQRSLLVGDVIVQQPGRRLIADKAYLYPDPKTGKIYMIDLFGNVQAYEPGKLIIGDQAHFNLQQKTGEIQDVYYRILLASEADFNQQQQIISTHIAKLTGLTAWGQAQTAQQTQPGHTQFQAATYTTCAPAAAVWHLKASKIKLNKETNRGSAYNARLYMGKVPVFYTPYISFPISKQRKTGFLSPLVGYSKDSGMEFNLPFYWNIAPNYDDTLTPTLYSRRGVLFDNLFRYLTPRSNGSLQTSIIFNDREFNKFKQSAINNPDYTSQPGYNNLLNAGNTRYLVSWQNFTRFDPHWSSNIDYTQVSDDYFLQDYGDVPEEISANQLLRRGTLQYADNHWLFRGTVLDYQTLHPVNQQPVGNVYSQLPDLMLDGNFPALTQNVDFTWHSEATYFYKKPLTSGTTVTTGGRFDVKPGVSLPYNWIWGYLQPTLYFDNTYYSLRNQTSGMPADITRTLPIFDIHSGLYFDRFFNLRHQAYQQTLEPEIFYLYVPYRDQNAIPNFSSGIIPFTYSQLFATNRFSGIDRIGDANQVTLALSTRIINQDSGTEKFRFSVGQIYYFRNRNVTLCNTPGCSSDYLTGLGATSNTERASPVATLMSYHITPAWSVNGGWAYDFHSKSSATASAYLAYQPAPNHIFNIGYNFLRNGDIISGLKPGDPRNNLHQISFNGAWPLNQRWSAVGVYNYSINQSHPQTYLAGLEYNSCCVRVRFVGGRVFSNIDQNGNFTFHNAFYLQLQLKGLGNLGSNSISSILSSSINGYVDPFQNKSWGF